MGCNRPRDVLKAVSQGIDFFDSAYPTRVTERNLASQYPINPVDYTLTSAPNPELSESDLELNKKVTDADKPGLYISLGLRQYAHDSRPILPHCECFTCKNHSRAYIHHLIRTREMTGLILLQIHNLYLYTKFFEKVREQVNNQTLKEYSDAMEKYLKDDDI